MLLKCNSPIINYAHIFCAELIKLNFNYFWATHILFITLYLLLIKGKRK